MPSTNFKYRICTCIHNIMMMDTYYVHSKHFATGATKGGGQVVCSGHALSHMITRDIAVAKHHLRQVGDQSKAAGTIRLCGWIAIAILASFVAS